jgi:hypothetical protein
MKTCAWKMFGRLLVVVVMGAPLFVPQSAQPATRTTKLATSGSTSTVCTKEGCSPADGEDQAGEADRKLGTTITWMQSPDAASRAATDEGKLVFLIQVSGNFARQEFT